MRLLAVVLAISGIALGLRTSTGVAHFDGNHPYTHAGCPASFENRVDPINVVFTGWGTWGRAES